MSHLIQQTFFLVKEASEEEMGHCERFGRSQEVLERVNKLEAEISQLEEARNFQIGLDHMLSEEQAQDATRRELVRAIDGRLKALQPEFRIAVAHAAAEGFSQFGAYHLRDACSKIFAPEKKGGMSGFGQSNQNKREAEEFETTFPVESDSDTDAQEDMGPMLKKQNSISSSCGKFQGKSCSLAFAWDDGDFIDNYNDMYTDPHSQWGKVDVNGKSRIETTNSENVESGFHNSRRMGNEGTINLFENKRKDTRYDMENMIWSRESDMSMDFPDEWIETKLSKDNNNKVDSGFLEYSTNVVPKCPEIPDLADSNIQLLKEMVENMKSSSQFAEHEHRGKHYELYSQKREAKLREVYSLKKSENEAKFNAMYIFLQESKRQILEMINRHTPITTQLGKEAEEAANTDTNELNNMNKPQIRKVTFSTLPPPPPTSCMNVDLMSPPTKASLSIPMPSPLTSSNFICSNKRKNPPSMPKNQLARSVPNFRDLRKENTKPLTARSGTLGLGTLASTSAHQRPKPQLGSSTANDPLKTKAKRKSAIQSTTSSPVKVDCPWSADNSMEKKWRNKQMMKSCASVSELRNLSGGGMLLNPPKISKVSGNINNSGESKTSLRKGRGGIGASARTKVM